MDKASFDMLTEIIDHALADQAAKRDQLLRKLESETRYRIIEELRDFIPVD